MYLTRAEWRKASRSSSNGGACIEVARHLPRIVAIRDSKDPGGPQLVTSPAAWQAFTTRLKAGRPGPPR
ncbi:MAG TPA: DUF397 domain-containing protein [Streptosporangiaceae bacterium]|jgi:hypothetical protein